MSALVERVVVGRRLETLALRLARPLVDLDTAVDPTTRLLPVVVVLAWQHGDLGCFVVSGLSHQGRCCILKLNLPACVIARHRHRPSIGEICQYGPPKHFSIDCLGRTSILLIAHDEVSFNAFGVQLECLS